MPLTWILRPLPAMLLLSAAAAHAHTGLKSSTPADGATIKVAPSELVLVFNGPVRLLRLELRRGERVVPIGFRPSGEALASHAVAAPAAGAGRFTVSWAAMGADGHTLTGSFAFAVDPAAPAGP